MYCIQLMIEKKMLLYVVHMIRYSHQKARNNCCRNILYVQHFVLINIAVGVIFVRSGWLTTPFLRFVSMICYMYTVFIIINLAAKMHVNKNNENRSFVVELIYTTYTCYIILSIRNGFVPIKCNIFNVLVIYTYLNARVHRFSLFFACANKRQYVVLRMFTRKSITNVA